MTGHVPSPPERRPECNPVGMQDARFHRSRAGTGQPGRVDGSQQVDPFASLEDIVERLPTHPFE